MMIAIGRPRQGQAGIVPTQQQTPEELEHRAPFHALHVPSNSFIDSRG